MAEAHRTPAGIEVAGSSAVGAGTAVAVAGTGVGAEEAAGGCHSVRHCQTRIGIF